MSCRLGQWTETELGARHQESIAKTTGCLSDTWSWTTSTKQETLMSRLRQRARGPGETAVTVYVDDMFKAPMGQFGRMKMSRMMADNDDELHAMADLIGVDRQHFQHTPSGDHYDISKGKRARAIEAGAIEITIYEMSAFAWHKHTRGSCVLPAQALVLMRETQRKLSNPVT
jgi:hypothetical protein